jgi:predicted ABC-type ATPase
MPGKRPRRRVRAPLASPAAGGPTIAILAGPNGAGKTTLALRLLPELGIGEFVNADLIAQGLSPFSPAGAEILAGRLMLERIREFAARRASFAFETTLASRTFAPFLAAERRRGYEVCIHYVWVRSPELAVSRVEERVRRGGHGVAADVVRRRYGRGLRNFFTLYQPVADSWVLVDNSLGTPVVVAQCTGRSARIHEPQTFEAIKAAFRRAGEEAGD